MGLPSISIKFQTLGASMIERGEKGTIAMILLDAAGVVGNYVLETNADIPSGLSDKNKEQINLAFMGGTNAPQKLLVSVVETDIAIAKKYLETVKWDYFVMPDATPVQVTELVGWVKALRVDGKNVKAVLPNASGADSEAVINFTTDNIKVGEKEYTTAEYCARIAGILAGNPLTTSSTFQVLGEVDDVPHLTKAELNTKIDAGELVLFHDGEKVKIARGINSLVTVTVEHGPAFKKIKIVDTLDQISNDVTATVNDNYIGKVSNSYDNKCLLIAAINGYFDQLLAQGVLGRGSYCEIDLVSQTNYLKVANRYTVGMSTQAIKEANTDDKVFLSAKIVPLDAMEEISLNIIL